MKAKQNIEVKTKLELVYQEPVYQRTETPVVKEVVVTLTVREAKLLAAMMGAISPVTAVELINKNHIVEKLNNLGTDLSEVNKLLGPLYHLYEQLSVKP